MPSVLSLDYETYCDLDIRRVGLDAYMSHASFAVLMAAYRIDRQPLQHWECHEGPVPADLREALLDPQVRRWAFNAAFERLATQVGLGIKTPIAGWRCSMVLSYMHSFTGGLAAVGTQMCLPVDQQKKKTGARLIKIFCGPQKPTKKHPHTRRNWDTDPEEWSEFCEYNKQDVVAEENLRDRLIKFPIQEDEWEFYGLDQEINDRGMPVDLDFVRNVAEMSERRRRELLDEMERLTGLDNANSVAQLLPWLQNQGYPYEDVRQENVRKALNRVEELWGTADHPVVEVLQRRLWAAKTSVKKANAALLSAGAGDRIRHMYKFAGASRTNRFSGALVQPQNLTRTPKLFDPEHDSSRLDCVTNMIRRGDYDAFELLVDEPMMAFAGCMRGMFRTRDDEEFHVCDYSSIESVGLAYVTRCERMLDVFRDGRDIYRDFGSRLFKKPYEAITSAERQISKPAVLGCGYRLGPGKLVDGHKTGLLAYAENMGIELTQDESVLAVTTFRETYAEVKQFWYDCETAVQHVMHTYKPYKLGCLRFEWMKPYLLIQLPSGRYIYYYKPRLEARLVKTGRMRPVYQGGIYLGDEEETYKRTVLTYMGRNQRKNTWERVEAHGGVTTENVVQALTRDILKVGLQRLHKAGFNIVGHAHDEAIAITRKGDNYYNWPRMREIMREPIDWVPGFPLNAAGWSGSYYRK
jgi:DNA polymerase